MTPAEVIYQRIKTLPEHDIEKILIFIDKLTKTTTKNKPQKKLTLNQQKELQAIAHQCATLPDLTQDNAEIILGYGINGVCE